MGVAVKDLAYITVKEYLEGEPLSDVRYEYWDGKVYAMAGAGANHGTISLNCGAALHAALRGSECRAFIADMKVHVQIEGSERFYYPDIVVACENEKEKSEFYRDYPKLIIEVLSSSTLRTDENEKLPAYQQLDSVEEIILIASKWVEVRHYRRESEWTETILTKLEDSLQLHSIDLSLPLADIYQDLDAATMRKPWYLFEQ